MDRSVKKLTISIVFAQFLLGFAVAWSQSILTPSARFIIVGDEGGFASSDQKAVAAAMAKEAERIKAQFVVTLGDNFHEDGITTATDPRWITEFEDVYSHPSLQIPWYPSLGNHDYRGNPEAELQHSNLSKRWKFTSRYYAQQESIDDSTSLLIVHLDTSPFLNQYRLQPTVHHMAGQDPKQQLVWLDSVLTISHARWTVVVGHHPIYSSTPKGGNTKELLEQLLPILKSHHVLLYVAGHQHFLQHLKHDAMDFIVSGGGADHSTVAVAQEDVVFGASALGFVSATATSRVLQLDFIDTTNTVLHTVRIANPSSK
jgi:tartrate-resistant acid phosphatase type 5